jgi:hypothetical protein
MSKKILYAISTLWLWHATRSMAIINYLLSKKYHIVILSNWNALNFLKEELKNIKNIEFVDFGDYPPLERWNWIMMYMYLIIDFIKTLIVIKRERQYVESRKSDFDLIFSDWRYGIYNKNIKSYIISHQISFIMPKFFGFLSWIINYCNYLFLKKFDKVLVPDFENNNKNMAWKLSHNKILNKLNHSYIWVLSFYENDIWTKKDIDYFFIITGYLQEHKWSFVDKLLSEAKKLKWKKVFVLWDTSKNYKEYLEDFDITIYSYVSWEIRDNLMKRANLVISRSGYTTIMDLVKLWKKAILFPTPNQTEQEYLAKYLWENWYFIVWKQEDNIDLIKLINKTDKIKMLETNNENFEKVLEKIIK